MCRSSGARKSLALSMHRWMCLEPAERKHTEAWDQRREQWELRVSRRLPKGRAGHLLGILSHLPSSSTYPGSMQIWCKPKLTQTSFCYRILVSPPPDSPPLYTYMCQWTYTSGETKMCPHISSHVPKCLHCTLSHLSPHGIPDNTVISLHRHRSRTPE